MSFQRIHRLSLFLILSFQLSLVNLYAHGNSIHDVLSDQDISETTISSDSRFLRKVLKKRVQEGDLEKAERISKILQKEVPSIEVSVEGVLNIIRASSYVNRHHRRVLDKNEAVYFEACKAFSYFAFQVYKDDTVYIHFGEKDPRKAKGGFKIFFRSLRLSDEKIFANLILDVTEEKQLDKLEKELVIMKKMKSSETNLTYEHFSLFEIKEDGHKKVKASIQTTLFDTDLSHYSHTHPSFRKKIDVFLLAAEGLSDFHAAGYVHLDIKRSNFFVNTPNNSPVELCLADYGLSKEIVLHEVLKNHVHGTKGYIDPYLCFLRNEQPKRKINFLDLKSSDIFSVGMIYYAMVFDKLELKRINFNINKSTMHSDVRTINTFRDYVRRHALEVRNLEREIATGEIDQGASILKRMIMKMISPVPNDRPSLSQVQMTIRAIQEKLL